MSSQRKIIAVVDDSPTILKTARNALMDEYDIVTLPSGEKLFQLLQQSPVRPNLILLDILMPGQSGLEVIKALKNMPGTQDIPVIFLTAKTDPESELAGLSLGAVDYVIKPFSPLLLKKRVSIHLLLEEQNRELKEINSNLSTLVRQKTASIVQLQEATLQMLGDLVEFRDDITGGHIARTMRLLYDFMDEILGRGLYADIVNQWDIHLFLQSSQLHDVGKISIPDSILLKPGALTSEEFEQMKTHTTVGEAMIVKLKEHLKDNAFFDHARATAVSHHENWDGSGYPHGLAGKHIPLQGRIMAYVDVYDALISSRPYKKSLPHEDAMGIICDLSGTKFDPALTSIFIDAMKRRAATRR